MNKQELIEALEEPKNNIQFIVGMNKYNNFLRGKKEAYVNAIGLAKQLDEPQNPVVPNCAEQFLKIAQSSNDVIQLFDSIIYATDSDGLILEKWGWSVDFYNWLAKDSDTLYILCDALRYGYEVEKEPLYYVKHKNDDTYFVEFINSSFSSIWDDEINRIKSFKDKTKADAVAVLVSGEVVEG